MLRPSHSLPLIARSVFLSFLSSFPLLPSLISLLFLPSLQLASLESSISEENVDGIYLGVPAVSVFFPRADLTSFSTIPSTRLCYFVAPSLFALSLGQSDRSLEVFFVLYIKALYPSKVSQRKNERERRDGEEESWIKLLHLYIRDRVDLE